MRPDVKLGIVISLVVVVVAGGYYVYRDARDVPIPVSGGPADLADAKEIKAGKTAHGTPAANKRASQDRATPAGTATGAKRGSTNRANRPAQPGATAPGQRTANHRAGTPRNNRKDTTDGSQNGGRAENRSNTGQPASNSVRGARTASANQRTGAVPRGAGAGGKATTQGARNSVKPGTDPGVAGAGTPAADRIARHTTDGNTGAGNRDGRPAAPGRRTGTSLMSRSAGQDTQVLTATIAVETHRLQPGDTLAGLSMAYFGSERHVPVLLAANPQITDPSRLRVGAVIKIPAAPDDMRVASAERTVSGNPLAQERTETRRSYTVKPGDSFYAIAQSQLGSSSRWEELFELNKGLVKGDPKRLQVGQVITLPE